MRQRNDNNQYGQQGQQQQQQQQGNKYRDHRDGFVSNLPFVRSIPIPTNPWARLLFSIALDIAGVFSQIIPVFGVAMFPAISSYLIYRLYGSTFGVILAFVEETIPGLGFIPTATLCWLNERYDLMTWANQNVPMFRQASSVFSMVKSVWSYVKVGLIAAACFIGYRLVSWLGFGGIGGGGGGTYPSSTVPPD
ncbi:hypothetical protein SAMD00019534_003700 [Acytostelium subglobosum LB1]|uniref:hypothetical protein n=1 Tax=Acytostelium subglobosum LB1 TaxID=1410327 RepID=UPI000644BEAD|nr:hypothetical protein SAMD00019534_003700 [Acytostelium subglobosum LB1]GAM17195.1 hypothetical protein SAMD00019534_003700 [Acytostelium subglobosum LB1]|eukprot:XP_012759257.1 hypothetical protein SAMD00019534_003700 [Acytostelium subglobosum LB1]